MSNNSKNTSLKSVNSGLRITKIPPHEKARARQKEIRSKLLRFLGSKPRQQLITGRQGRIDNQLGSWANDPGIWVHHMFPSRGPTITGFGGALMAIDFNQKERVAVDCCRCRD